MSVTWQQSGSRQSSSIQAKTRCVLLSSQHPSEDKKPRRNRICREEEPKQGEQGSDLKTFLTAQHLKAWEVGMTHPCSRVWPRCWEHREPQEETKWGDVPSPGNQAMVGPKGTSQPRLLGLRCWREEQLKLESHSDTAKKSKSSPQKNAAVPGKCLLCPPLLILSCKDAVPCGEP